MYHLLANYASVNSATVVQLQAVADGNFSQSSNSYIFTEPYNLMAIYASGATIAIAQINDPLLNAINNFQVYPAQKSLTPLTNPNVMYLGDAPQTIPLNEQFMAQAANSAGGAEATLMLWWIQPPNGGGVDWSIKPGTAINPRTLAVFTATIVLTVGVWSPLVQITFTNPLKGGAYQINSTKLICASGTAYRWMFPKQPPYAGRKLQSGSLCEAAYGNVPWDKGTNWLGGQGRFNYFEPPQIQAIGNATVGSTTYTGYMDLTYLGDPGVGMVP